jgi:TorA maturation chaperone TorD
MQEILENQDARINLYALISRLLMSEIDKDFLNIIEKDENMLSFFPSYLKWDKKDKLSKEDLLNQYLNPDFTNLFLLHMIPYESFYVRGDQQMETGGDNPLQQLYNEHDFRVDLTKARAISVDHIGIEFEFMYMLCEAEKKALNDNALTVACEIAKIQQKFLKEHLLEWSPMFLLNMKSEAGTALYFDLADLALEFMLSDYEYLNQIINKNECSYK